MEQIREARIEDICRIAEIFVFNNRINYYPIFNDEQFSFVGLTVECVIDHYEEIIGKLENTYVYDDGVIRAFMNVQDGELKKLYADPFFQRKGYGALLLEYAKEVFQITHMWVLEKNISGLRFYHRHGFSENGNRKYEEGTTEWLVEMETEHECRTDVE